VSDRIGGRLAAILRGGGFAVTGEIVPPRSGDGSVVSDLARGQVGYIDAANVTDNPTATAHMSAVAGVAFVARAGIEPTLQLTCRDRNRLAITSELLGAWALGARNVLCLTGDPVGVGDHPDAAAVHDLTVDRVVGLVRRLRETGTTLGGSEIAAPPSYLIGVADVPLARPYDPARLEQKLDAGADVIWTQIAYDVEALAAWADLLRPRGVFERAKALVGVVPLRSAKAARFMEERLPGVHVPDTIVNALGSAGDDGEAVGLELTAEVVRGVREIDGVSGVHVMGLGSDDRVRALAERAGLFPRPTVTR
jgi:methylenetetrahydrofolate reductase (NADPH)